MNRRTFARNMAGTVAAACGLANQSLLLGAETSAKSTPQDVPFNLSIMLWTVYRDLPFEQRLEKMSQAGFKNVELVGEYSTWSEDEFQRINTKRKQLGI